MKYIVTSVILLITVSLTNAQTNAATPNANFESWVSHTNYNDASQWNDLNSTTGILGFYTLYQDNVTVKSGTYSAQLVTNYYSLLSLTVPGVLTTGTINTTNYTISGGLPYTLRPDSIIGWYQYVSVSNDHANCEFYLFGSSNTDTIGQAFYRSPTTNVSTWTRFSLPVTYTSVATPQTALWIFSSSIDQNSGHAGSQLIIDSIGLVFNSSAVNTIKDNAVVGIGPNPTNGPLTVSIASSRGASLAGKVFTMNVLDVTGRLVKSEKITEGTTVLNIGELPEGLYIYSLLDEEGIVIKTGKIAVQR
jgi:Secretion system C-terminal sorting domain